MVTQSIPLVADLRSQNKNIGTIYLATGLVVEGDTGGGIYFWNPILTNPDDGFYYLQVTGVATGRWTRIYAGSNIYNTDGALLDNRDVTLNGSYLKFIGSSANSTFNADGSVTLGSLSGVDTRIVVANNAGTLGTQSFVPGTTIRFVEKFTATLGQTVFNIVNTLYNDLFDVFLNGVKLDDDSFSYTSNQITLDDASYAGDIIDVIGFSSATVYASLPSQAGNAGKYLSTDGANLSWATVNTSNIYNSDGTLTGNRLVTMGAYTLSFSGDLLVNEITVGKGGGNIATNTAIGKSSLQYNTSGYSNTALGIYSLWNNTTGYYNNSIGGSSLLSNTTGNSNTAIGVFSLYYNTIGNSNTALGYRSGMGAGPNRNISGSNNIFIGYESVGVSSSESNRTWIGNSSTLSTWLGGNLLLGTTTNGIYGIDLVGKDARINGLTVGLGNNNIATNTFFGTGSGSAITTGNSNLAIGYNSGLGITTGNANVLLGFYVGRLISTGTWNISIGPSSAFNLTTGNSNTFIGKQAGIGITTGGNNILISSRVTGGSGIIDGSNNTIIGNEIGGLASTLSNNIILADGQGNIRIRAFDTGNVSINSNTDVASAQLSVTSTTKGFLPPRMTTTERNAIATPATGLQVYNTTTNENNTYNGTAWVAAGGSNIYTADGTLTAARTLTHGGFNLSLVGSTHTNRFTSAGRLLLGTTTESTYILDVNGTARISSTTLLSSLSGSGTRMVTADATGVLSTQAIPAGTLSSVGITMPSAFSVSNSPLTSDGTIDVTGAGTTLQYIDGTGALQTLPTRLESDSLVATVRNQSGATMTKGTIVYISGATGNKALISKALATGDATSAQTFGMLQNDIANNADGHVVIIGDVTDINTVGYPEGTQLYLSGTTAGTWTSTKPYAPTHLVYVGIVIREHINFGVISIKIQNGYEMDELHNVSAQSPTNNDGLFWNSSTNLWSKNTIAGVLGYTPANGNIYTADGTLTGNRTVSGGGFTLTLNPDINLSGSLFGNTLRTRNYFSGSYTQPATVFSNSSLTFDGLTSTGNTLYMGQSNIEVTGGSSGIQSQGIDIEQHIKLSGATSLMQMQNYILQYRGYTGDISTNANNYMIGMSVITGHNVSQTTTNIVTGNVSVYQASVINKGGTINNAFGFDSILNATTFSSQKSSIITNYYSFRSIATIGATSGAATATITNYYGIYLDAPSVRATGTITNRWGIYAPDAAMPHYLNGNLLLGTTTNSTYKLDVNGTARVSGAIFQSFGYLNSTINLISEGTTTTAGYRSVIIGHNTSMSYIAGTSANEAVVIGTINSSNYGNQIVAIGYNASVTSTYGVAIGSGATSSAGGVAIRGTESGNGIAILGTTSGSSGVALLGNNSAGQGVAIGGSSSVTSGAPSMAIGFKATSANNWGIALQMGVTRANNQFVAGGYETGSGNGWISEVYFGSGVVGDNTTTHSGRNYSINGSGSFGTNQTGGNITIAGGKGTGTGTSGDIIFSTSTALTTGTTLQSLTNRWWVKGSTGSFSNIASPNTSAIIQADSTTQGFLPPRMTAAQKTAIATPAEGLMIYQTDGVKGWWGYDGAAWRALAMI